MLRKLRPTLGALVSMLLAVSASAQQLGVQWQQDIETAKAMARQSGRLVLVHVVADGCGPCAALEKNVFNQPGVAAAIDQKFVPVKLNANEFPGIATGFGVTRVPTDIIITPDGQILSKTISPPTPMGYLAEATAVATRYSNQMTPPSQAAPTYVAAATPNPAQLNPAYSNLNIGEATKVPPMTTPAAQATTTPNAYAATNDPQTPQPSTVMNGYAAAFAATNDASQAPVTPVPTNPAANPYGSYAPPTQTPTQSPAAATSSRYGGYEAAAGPQPAASQPATVPPDTSVPPSNPAGPVSEEAQRQTTTQMAAAPDPSKLPAGAPPLGFDGYCPVSMRRAWKWVPGDARYGAIHMGRTYWFAGPSEQQEFLAKPDLYSPALAGIDPVLAIDHRQSVPGVREHSLDYEGQFYLFSSEATLQQFTSSPERYANGVRQAMSQQAPQQTR